MSHVKANGSNTHSSLVRGAKAKNAYILGSSLSKALANTLRIIMSKKHVSSKERKKEAAKPIYLLRC
jgi:hypothetical protein